MRLVALVALLLACSESPDAVMPAGRAVPPAGDLAAGPPLNVPAQGQYIFRHWTFGDEPFWTDTLHLNQVIETGVSPATALAVGLKVDAARLPRLPRRCRSHQSGDDGRVAPAGRRRGRRGPGHRRPAHQA